MDRLVKFQQRQTAQKEKIRAFFKYLLNFQKNKRLFLAFVSFPTPAKWFQCELVILCVKLHSIAGFHQELYFVQDHAALFKLRLVAQF